MVEKRAALTSLACLLLAQCTATEENPHHNGDAIHTDDSSSYEYE